MIEDAQTYEHRFVARRFVRLTLVKTDEAQGAAMLAQTPTYDDLREVLANAVRVACCSCSTR
jgi:hypothetical protein